MKAEFKAFSKKAFEDVDLKKGIVCGYLNRYGVIDNEGDIIKAGAGKKTVNERGVNGANLVKHLWNHDTNQPIAKYNVLEERESGVYFEAQFSKTQTAQDRLIQIDEGIITTNSFGFTIVNSTYEGDTRVISEYKLWEGSSVSIAANDLAVITELKGMTEGEALKLALEKINALKSAIRKSDASEESLEQLYFEAIKAEQYIKEMCEKPSTDTSSTEPPKGTHDEDYKALSDVIKSFSSKLN